MTLKHTLPVLLATAIGLGLGTGAAQAQADCIEDYQPGVDYFADKVEPIYAENFTVAYYDSYVVATVSQPFPGGAPENYVLLHCGAPVPELVGELAEAPVISVPVSSMFSASTTHFPAIDALDAVGAVTGVASLAYATTESFLAAGEAGTITQFAANYATDVEIVIDAAPDIFMTGGSDDPSYDVLRDAGVPVVANAEWLEPSLLGRAEWIKFIALFLGREAAANAVFDEVEQSYLDAAAAVADLPDDARPLVLAGSSFQGVFYAPGGRSYSAEAIASAGGRYVFGEDEGTASLAFADLEEIIDVSEDVAFWINATTAYQTLADIAADDPRLAALPAAEAANVWNYDRISTPSGGVGFFELGVLRPDLILRDLIEVFHPGTLDGHEFVFYRPVTID